MAAPTAFALKLATIAQTQHTTYHLLDEADPVLCKQIKKYWSGIAAFTSCVSVPWSAVFVSWCVKQAGATAAEFNFAAAHSEFVYAAIRNAINGTGVFRGLDIGAHPPSIGDIIHNNRGGTSYDYAYARTHKDYASHSAIVVETGLDTDGRYALTIGGNEGNSIRRTVVRLNQQGLIKQRSNNPFICVIKTLK